MGFRQPPVAPLPDDLDLNGRTAVVTGASAGLGLEFARQLLQRRVSTLILAVRNISKGEDVKCQLLSEPETKRINPGANVKVMKLDTASYSSVKGFAKEFRAANLDLDILMLNAGIGILKREITHDGHEMNMEVNYLSNILLLFELLPVLESTATRTGRPSRVSITGSRMHGTASVTKATIDSDQTIVQYLDSPEGFASFQRYGDTKLLVVLFLRELANHYGPDKVIVNNFCPGMVNTGMSDVLPIYFRAAVNLVKALRARKLEVGGSIGLHAACVAGAETHGKLLGDKKIER